MEYLGRSRGVSLMPVLRLLIFMLFLAAAQSCSDSSRNAPAPARTPTSQAPAYAPATFRADITSLIAEKRYADAIDYLAAADPVRQAEHDGSGYLAVAEDMIVLPGVYPDIDYDRERDWVFPGTSDVIEAAAWQRAATDFAARYNAARRGG